MSAEPGKRKDLYEQWVDSEEAEGNLAILKSLAMQGKTMDEIAAEFGTTSRNLRRLKKQHSSVSSALKKGRQSVVAEAQDALRLRIAAGDITAIIYALKIYGGDFFNDRAKLEVKADVDATIRTNPLAGWTDEELKQAAAALPPTGD